MAYTQLAAANPSLTGATVALTAAPAAGDAVKPGSFLLVNNGSGSAVTVTLNIPRTYKGYAITSPTVSVLAGTQVAIGPIPSDPFVRIGTGTDDGFVRVDYSSVTSVTRANIQVNV